MKTELKAVEILREKLKELWDTRPFWFGCEAHHEKIFAVEDAIKELQELTQEKSCEGCALICVDGRDCDTAQKTKEAIGMKYSEMCFHCYTPKR